MECSQDQVDGQKTGKEQGYCQVHEKSTCTLAKSPSPSTQTLYLICHNMKKDKKGKHHKLFQASHNEAACHHLSKEISSSHNKQLPSFTTIKKTCHIVPYVVIPIIGQDLTALQAIINVKTMNSMVIVQISVLTLNSKCKLVTPSKCSGSIPVTLIQPIPVCYPKLCRGSLQCKQ